jgi:hypothetical protein
VSSNDKLVGGATARWQGFVADLNAWFRCLCVREIALGQSSSGLDSGGGVGARAELFVFEEGSGDWINDGVAARRKTVYCSNEIY